MSWPMLAKKTKYRVDEEALAYQNFGTVDPGLHPIIPLYTISSEYL